MSPKPVQKTAIHNQLIIVDPDGNVVASIEEADELIVHACIWMRVILAKAQYLILRDTDVLSITLYFNSDGVGDQINVTSLTSTNLQPVSVTNY